MPVVAECTSHDATFENQGNSTKTTISTNPGDDIATISLEQLPSGIYFVSLLSESEKLDTEKFIIK